MSEQKIPLSRVRFNCGDCTDFTKVDLEGHTCYTCGTSDLITVEKCAGCSDKAAYYCFCQKCYENWQYFAFLCDDKKNIRIRYFSCPTIKCLKRHVDHNAHFYRDTKYKICTKVSLDYNLLPFYITNSTYINEF